MPLASIITATYNSQDYVRYCYESILSQIETDWEWLVTDDCSQDNTFNILSAIQKEDSRVKVFRNPENSGAAISRNRSLKDARGRYIAFLDSDDTWSPQKLSKQIEFMEEGHDFSFTSFRVVEYDTGKEKGLVDKELKKSEFGYVDFLKKEATFGCSTVMLRNKTDHVFSMPNIRTGQDYAFWLSVVRSGCQAVWFPETLTNYFVRKESISRNKFKKAVRQWHIYRKIEKISMLLACWYFLYYAKNALFRK